MWLLKVISTHGKQQNWGRKHFKRQTLISFKCLPVTSSPISVSCSPACLLGSQFPNNEQQVRKSTNKHTQVTWKKFKKVQVPYSVLYCSFGLHVQRQFKEFSCYANKKKEKRKLKSKRFWRNQFAENANLV